MHDRVSQAVGRRETAIERSLRSAARELVQAGLFDRHAPRRGNQRPAGQVLRGTMDRSERTILRARLRLRAVLCGRLA